MQSTSKTHHFLFFSIVAITLLIPALFYETVRPMVQVWIVNETFTHGFLILPISLWLLWQKKDFFSHQTIAPEPRLLVLLFPIAVAWFISQVVGVQVVQQLALVSMIPVLVWLLFGRKILFLSLFPLLYLFFAVPLGQSLIPPLMEFTANFTVFLIKLFGIPVYRDGFHFTLPSGDWSVVEECSGVRYLIASIALGTIYAYINYSSVTKRLIFLCMAIVAPIIANGLRAFGIVMTGHLSNMEYATGVDHLLYGWVFFGIVIFLMFYVGSFWWDPVIKAEPLDEKTQTPLNPFANKTFQLMLVMSILLLTIVKLYAYQVVNFRPEIPQDLNLSLPDYFEGWQYTQNHSLNWAPEILSPDASINKVYHYGNDLVQVDIGYYLYQRQDAEVVSSENRMTNPYGGHWKITYSSEFQQQDLFVRETELHRSGNKILVWQWYRLGALQSPSPYIAKVFEAYNQVVTKRSDGAYMTVSTTLDEDKEAARSRLRGFLTAASGEIDRRLESLSQHD